MKRQFKYRWEFTQNGENIEEQWGLARMLVFETFQSDDEAMVLTELDLDAPDSIISINGYHKLEGDDLIISRFQSYGQCDLVQEECVPYFSAIMMILDLCVDGFEWHTEGHYGWEGEWMSINSFDDRSFDWILDNAPDELPDMEEMINERTG